VVHPFLQHDGPIPFVHRGGPVGSAENTLAAFDRAYALGFRYFETDVHATSDGELVAFHDRTLRRLAGERTAIADLTWDEVSQVRVDGEPVPRLHDLLVTFPDVRLNIDPKHDAAVRPLIDVLRARSALERVCLASFSDRRLAFLRVALGPGVCTAAGPREVVRVRAAASRRRTVSLQADVLQVPPGTGRLDLVDERFVRTAHESTLPVHVWTVNDEAEMHRLLDLGVDGLMSDDPLLLRSVLVTRGDWSGDTTTR
jgi:glycerophosphoryl diester phosphodiesterase